MAPREEHGLFAGQGEEKVDESSLKLVRQGAISVQRYCCTVYKRLQGSEALASTSCTIPFTLFRRLMYTSCVHDVWIHFI